MGLLRDILAKGNFQSPITKIRVFCHQDDIPKLEPELVAICSAIDAEYQILHGERINLAPEVAGLGPRTVIILQGRPALMVHSSPNRITTLTYQPLN